MRLSYPIIAAGALLVTAPALAQSNVEAPTNAVSANTVDMNTAAATNAAPAAPANQETLAQAATAPMPVQPQTAPVEVRRGFPWGVLGLLGLIGLFGARKIKG
jgi:hypothetical protein